jgi:hypothetical protein
MPLIPMHLDSTFRVLRLRTDFLVSRLKNPYAACKKVHLLGWVRYRI